MNIFIGLILLLIIVAVIFQSSKQEKSSENKTSDESIKDYAKTRRENIEKETSSSVLLCVHRGGDWFPLDFGSVYYLSCKGDSLRISHAISEKEISIKFEDIYDIVISGPDATVTDGGFVGGGFGIEGALKGIAIAAIANAATTVKTYDTTFRISSVKGETILQFNDMGPNDLTSKFPELLAALQKNRNSKSRVAKEVSKSISGLTPASVLKIMEFVSSTTLVLSETIYEQANDQLLIDIYALGPQDCVVNGLNLYALRTLLDDGVVNSRKIEIYSSVISALHSYEEKDCEYYAENAIENYIKTIDRGLPERLLPIFYTSLKLYDNQHATHHSQESFDFLAWFSKALIESSQTNADKALELQNKIKADLNMDVGLLLKKYHEGAYNGRPPADI